MLHTSSEKGQCAAVSADKLQTTTKPWEHSHNKNEKKKQKKTHSNLKNATTNHPLRKTRETSQIGWATTT
jgi:hypothetical protein